MNTRDKKTALITGASRGLGLALAHELARRGLRLALVARNGSELERAAAGVEGEPLLIAQDVSQGAEEIAARVQEHFGELDILVNNASTVGPSPMPPLADYHWSELERVFRVNTLAPLHLTQLLLSKLSPQGVVLNVTSDAAVANYAGWGGYGASKAALEHLTRTLMVEAPEVRFYLVDPGDMNTQMHQEAEPGVDLSHLPGPGPSGRFLADLLLSGEASGRFQAGAQLVGA